MKALLSFFSIKTLKPGGAFKARVSLHRPTTRAGTLPAHPTVLYGCKLRKQVQFESRYLFIRLNF